MYAAMDVGCHLEQKATVKTMSVVTLMTGKSKSHSEAFDL